MTGRGERAFWAEERTLYLNGAVVNMVQTPAKTHCVDSLRSTLPYVNSNSVKKKIRLPIMKKRKKKERRGDRREAERVGCGSTSPGSNQGKWRHWLNLKAGLTNMMLSAQWLWLVWGGWARTGE